MRKQWLVLSALLLLLAMPSQAFLEDLCIPRKGQKGPLSWCINPNCLSPLNTPNRVCPQQVADFFAIQPGRSMVHADSTYFIAQALGYRADVAYWIAAYNEVADYALYNPIDQCGTSASASNSGKNFMAAAFNGFQRTNNKTDGPLDHYVVSFSPNGQGTDVHGAGGVQAVYPLYYPRPGYPVHIDETYQKTLANLREWALIASTDPGLLCTVGLESDTTASHCFEGNITGTVPFLKIANNRGANITATAGLKILNLDTNTGAKDYYDKLESYLNDPSKTTGTLWMSPSSTPVPVQVARMGLYLHILQDTSSHSTYCGDDAPSVPGGQDPGTYMYIDGTNVKVMFGLGCANSPHLAGHLQETGTGASALPLRDYAALNNTVDELIVYGNEVALKNGWIANPELLPPDVVGGLSGQKMNAQMLKELLVGKIVGGTPAYTRGEIYQSGLVTINLQQTDTNTRLANMNSALGNYGNTVRSHSTDPSKFVPFQPMPGNSFTAGDTSVCWK